MRKNCVPNRKSYGIQPSPVLFLFFFIIICSTQYYGYSKTKPANTVVAAPIISSFLPVKASAGDTVTITGANFTGTTSVKFGDIEAAAFTVVDNATIIAVIGEVQSGNVVVTSLDGSGTLAGFIFCTPPVINIAVSPSGTLCQGASVTLTATGANTYSWNNGISNGVPFVPVANNIFSAKSNFATANAPQGIATGDLDGDGKKDIVVTNYQNSSISIYRNTSTEGVLDNSSFDAKVDIGVSSLPFGVAIEDVDGDGKKDISVTNSLSNSILVFRNISTAGVLNIASFSPAVSFATGDTPLGIVIADIDGDGKKDMVVSNSSSASISIYRNTSTTGNISAGSFAARINFTTNFNPHGVAVDDIDGDGKLDIAVTNYGENTISVFRNTSTPGSITASSLQSKIDFVTGLEPFSVAIADIDGDGKKDMIAACPGDNTLSILHNTSTTGVINETSFGSAINFATSAFPLYVAIADMNGDAKNDIIVTNPGDNNFSYFKNIAVQGEIDNQSLDTKYDVASGDNTRGGSYC